MNSLPFFAILNNARGQRYMDQQDDVTKAETAFFKALVYDPDWSVPHYNLGLLYTRLHAWEQSFHHNQRAAHLDPEDEAAWWNLGIAATALRNWPEARRAWSACGLVLPHSDDEVRMALGRTPIRLVTDDQGEVVWCERIDPARAIIRNIPLPSAGHRFGDMVLHDGAPNGTRTFRGREYPVFDELQLFAASSYATYHVEVEVATQTDLEALINAAGVFDVHIEDWSTIRHLCVPCSEGDAPAYEAPQPHQPDTSVVLGCAAISETDVRQLLERWVRQHPGNTILDVKCVVSSAAREV